MPESIDFLELNTGKTEDAVLKNRFIMDGTAAWLGIYNSDITNREETIKIIEEYGAWPKYQAVFLGNMNGNGGCMDLTEVLRNPDMKIYALVFKRSLLEKTGSFHEMFPALNTYEFLCRIAAETAVYGILCEAEGLLAEHVHWNEKSAQTLAYIARRYMVTLKAEGSLDEIFNGLAAYMLKQGCSREFYTAMDRMLNVPSAFEDLAAYTAPFLVLVGDETCYSVPKRFAHLLSDAFVDLGQAVITTDGRYGEWNISGSSTVLPILKGVVGFQMKVLERDLFRRMRCPKYQFWFDNPIYFDDMLRDLPKEYYILCQDLDYAEYIKKYYHTEHAVQFPPAGEDAGYSDNRERPLDVVFIGSFREELSTEAFSDEERRFYKYMLAHPDINFEEGYRCYKRDCGSVNCREEDIAGGLEKLLDVCRAVTAYYRIAVIETLLQAGIELHVYGETWRKYHSRYDDHLIRHPEVSVEESLNVLGHTKIGLNIMTWHKAGMTERIANIMLSGAVCLSEETSYLKKNYTDGEDIVLFKLSELSTLPQKVTGLLQLEDLRRRIAEKAYQRTRREHTWIRRTKELLTLRDHIEDSLSEDV